MTINTPIGNIHIQLNNKKIVAISFSSASNSTPEHYSTDLGNSILTQITQYFTGRLTEFNLPIELDGTKFQKKVWQEIAKIPYGSTATYKQIAINLGKEKSARAIGRACNQNPIPIIIPCHRVIGSRGDLVGYNGGIDKKAFLLNLEKNSDRL